MDGASTTAVAVDTKPLATVAAVARFLSLSRSKVYQLMQSGDLPYVKLGRVRRVRWADVSALVDQSRIGGQSS